jgi:hypothetical protein
MNQDVSGGGLGCDPRRKDQRLADGALVEVGNGFGGAVDDGTGTAVDGGAVDDGTGAAVEGGAVDDGTGAAVEGGAVDDGTGAAVEGGAVDDGTGAAVEGGAVDDGTGTAVDDGTGEGAAVGGFVADVGLAGAAPPSANALAATVVPRTARPVAVTAMSRARFAGFKGIQWLQTAIMAPGVGTVAWKDAWGRNRLSIAM